MLIALLAFGAGGAALYAPPAQGQVAVVFPPWTSEAQAFAAIRDAGGGYVAPSRFSNIVVAFARDPGFQDRMRSAGALFFLAARGLCEPLLDPSTDS